MIIGGRGYCGICGINGCMCQPKKCCGIYPPIKLCGCEIQKMIMTPIKEKLEKVREKLSASTKILDEATDLKNRSDKLINLAKEIAEECKELYDEAEKELRVLNEGNPKL